GSVAGEDGACIFVLERGAYIITRARASFDDLRNFLAVEFAQHAETDRRVAHVDTGVVGGIDALIGRAVAPRTAAEQAFGACVVVVLARARLAVAHPFADVADEIVNADLVRLELADRRGEGETVAARRSLAAAKQSALLVGEVALRAEGGFRGIPARRVQPLGARGQAIARVRSRAEPLRI